MAPIELESPFRWIENTELALNFDENQELNIDVYEEPVLSLMNDIMSVYFRTVKEDYDRAEKKLKEVEEKWELLDKGEIQKENVSVNVLSHVIQATKYYVYDKTGNVSGMEEVLKIIENSEKLKDLMDFSTIDGCKAIAWSTFHEAECIKAISYAQSAIEQNSECPLWHYLLAKNLRRERRRISCYSEPSIEEKYSALKCRDLSPKNFYKLLYAQTLQNKKKSMEIYLEIYQSNPVSVNLQLRLALAFIRNKKYAEAKSCLDYAEKHRPENKMFLHYKAIYIMDAENDLERAMEYLKKSAEHFNFPADITYAKCLMELNKVLNCTQHLQNMLCKYKSVSDMQQILLDLAMLYWRESNFNVAATNFLKAVELDQVSQLLQCYNNELDDRRTYNIFEFIRNQVTPKLKETLNNFNDPEYIIIEKLEELCKSETMHELQYKYTYEDLIDQLEDRCSPSRERSFSSSNHGIRQSRYDQCRRSTFPPDQSSSRKNEIECTRSGHCGGFSAEKEENFSLSNQGDEWSPIPCSDPFFAAKDQTFSRCNDDAKLCSANGTPQSKNQFSSATDKKTEWTPIPRSRRLSPAMEQSSCRKKAKFLSSDELPQSKDQFSSSCNNNSDWAPIPRSHRNSPPSKQTFSSFSKEDEFSLADRRSCSKDQLSSFNSNSEWIPVPRSRQNFSARKQTASSHTKESEEKWSSSNDQSEWTPIPRSRQNSSTRVESSSFKKDNEFATTGNLTQSKDQFVTSNNSEWAPIPRSDQNFQSRERNFSSRAKETEEKWSRSRRWSKNSRGQSRGRKRNFSARNSKFKKERSPTRNFRRYPPANRETVESKSNESNWSPPNHQLSQPQDQFYSNNKEEWSPLANQISQPKDRSGSKPNNRMDWSPPAHHRLQSQDQFGASSTGREEWSPLTDQHSQSLDRSYLKPNSKEEWSPVSKQCFQPQDRSFSKPNNKEEWSPVSKQCFQPQDRSFSKSNNQKEWFPPAYQRSQSRDKFGSSCDGKEELTPSSQQLPSTLPKEYSSSANNQTECSHLTSNFPSPKVENMTSSIDEAEMIIKDETTLSDQPCQISPKNDNFQLEQSSQSTSPKNNQTFIQSNDQSEEVYINGQSQTMPLGNEVVVSSLCHENEASTVEPCPSSTTTDLIFSTHPKVDNLCTNFRSPSPKNQIFTGSNNNYNEKSPVHEITNRSSPTKKLTFSSPGYEIVKSPTEQLSRPTSPKENIPPVNDHRELSLSAVALSPHPSKDKTNETRTTLLTNNTKWSPSTQSLQPCSLANEVTLASNQTEESISIRQQSRSTMDRDPRLKNKKFSSIDKNDDLVGLSHSSDSNCSDKLEWKPLKPQSRIYLSDKDQNNCKNLDLNSFYRCPKKF